MDCSCKRARCSRCLKCSSCSCKCPNEPQRRTKRARAQVSYIEDNEVLDSGTTNPAATVVAQQLPPLPASSVASSNSSSKENDWLAVIREALSMDTNSTNNLPSTKQRREKSILEIDEDKRRRMVKFVLDSTKAICQGLYPKDPAALLQLSIERTIKDSDAAVYDRKLKENLKKASDALPRLSMQRKVLLAPLCTAYPHKILTKEFNLTNEAVSSSRRNYKSLEAGTKLQAPVNVRVAYDNNMVQRAVKFIISEANVQHISWGTKQLLIDGKQVDFPNLVRKKVVEVMLRDFIERYPDPKERIGNTSFKKIAKALTSHDQKEARQAVDCDSGKLLYDNFEMLRRIVVACSDNNSPDELLKKVNALEAFMKNEYEDHVDTCNVTKTAYSLSRGDQTLARSTCETCCLPHRVMHFLESQVNRTQLLRDCAEKLKLYQGHRVRVANQQRAINDLLSGLKPNQAYIVMSFKMKFEAIYYQGKTTDFCGKKGSSSWHGVMMYTRYTEEEKLAHSKDSDKPLEPHHISYFDQISSGDSTQDWVAVLTYFEATCLGLKEQFPHVDEILVQTDSARAYKAPELILGMKLVAEKHRLKLITYIHTGVQDGKCPIDGHFAVAMKHVLRYCNNGNNVVTPVEIIDALRSNGGINNSIAEMVSINRPKIKALVAEYSVVVQNIISHVNGRHAEVQYDFDQNTVTTFTYSRSGTGKVCSLSKENCISTAMSPSTNEDSEEAEDEETSQLIYDDDDMNESRELISTARGAITGCIIYGGQLLRRRNRVARSIRVQDIESEVEDDLQCQICSQRFTFSSTKSRHVCKGIVGRRPLLQYALAFAFDTINQRDTHIVNAGEDLIASVIFEGVPLNDNVVFFEAGWARAPPHGRMYGRKYIEPFKDDIVRMYTDGVGDASKRLGPGGMLERIRRQNPERLDLPSENEIRQAITTLVAKAKKGKTKTLTSNRGVSQPYLGTIIRLFRESGGQMKRKDFYGEFLKVHSAPSDEERCLLTSYPDKKQVMSKFSQLKTKFKRTNILPILDS